MSSGDSKPARSRTVIEWVSRGSPAEDFLVLLRRACRKAASGRPTDTGAWEWSADDVDELASAVVVAIKPGPLVIAALTASSDAQFGSYLWRSAKRVLDMRARKSPSGWVLRNVNEKLAADGRFARDAEGWHLAGEDRAIFDGDVRDLVTVAWTVDTTAARHDPNAERGAPLASRKDLSAVCAEVLAVAGKLRPETLGFVIAQRFNASFADRYTDPLPDYESREAHEPLAADAPDHEVIVEQAAVWVVGQLTDDERSVLAIVVKGASIEEVGSAMGWGRSKAYEVRTRILARLERLTAAIGDSDGTVMQRAMAICSGPMQDLRHFEIRDDPDAD